MTSSSVNLREIEPTVSLVGGRVHWNSGHMKSLPVLL